MNIAIVVSKKDPAGLNIKESLINEFNFVSSTELFQENPVFVKSDLNSKSNLNFSLFTLNELHLFADNLDSQIQADSGCFDFIVFASKHKGKEPCFSVHSTGNFSQADFGGQSNQISLASACLNKNLLISLQNNASKFNFTRPVCLEVTHHGPLLTKIPSAFAEIGCSEKEWLDKKACRLIAASILDCFSNFNSNFKIAFGIGSTHYAPEFTKIQLNSDIALSHILPKYFDTSLSFDLFKQLISRTKEKIDFALVDKVSLNENQIKLVEDYCSKLKIKLVEDYCSKLKVKLVDAKEFH